jgi:predicted protein tyrosine phosphatase
VRVDVYSRTNACGLDPTPNTVVISICCPGDPCTLKEGWEDVLRLEFHDVVRIPQGLADGDIIAFNIDHADQIHAFIEKHEGKDFMVHCAAGLSRSVAVGSFMREVHGADLHLHEIHSDEFANSRVRRALMHKYWSAQFAGSK